jgi:hypothetical protein
MNEASPVPDNMTAIALFLTPEYLHSIYALIEHKQDPKEPAKTPVYAHNEHKYYSDYLIDYQPLFHTRVAGQLLV